jgi:uncharacterized protein YndB with AHSA1/START domain
MAALARPLFSLQAKASQAQGYPGADRCGLESRQPRLGSSVRGCRFAIDDRSIPTSHKRHTGKRRGSLGTCNEEIDMSNSTSTIHLHRVLRAPAERVYRAFLEPDAMAKWLPPHGFVGKVHQMDARVGGGYRMSFTNFGTGNSHSFGGSYLELSPNERIRYVDQFEDPAMPGEMLVTVTLRAVTGGTDLEIEQQGVPSAIPAEMCYLGWQESLSMLAQLVEPEIPDGG